MRIGELLRNSHHEFNGLPRDEKLDPQEREDHMGVSTSTALTRRPTNHIISNLAKIYREYELPLEKRGVSLTTNLFDPGHPIILDANSVVFTMAKMVIPWILRNCEVTGKSPSLDTSVSFEYRSNFIFKLRVTGFDLAIKRDERSEVFRSGRARYSAEALQRHLEYVGGSFRVKTQPNLLLVYQLPVNSNLVSSERKTNFHEIIEPKKRAQNLRLERKVKVLFVENHEGQRELFSFIAEKERFTCVTVSDGRGAVALIQNGADFDCIVVDSRLEAMHGPEAVQLIRTLGYSRCIIGITASNDCCEITAFLNMGVDTVISKPFSFNRLMKLIKQRIKFHRQETQSNAAG